MSTKLYVHAHNLQSVSETKGEYGGNRCVSRDLRKCVHLWIKVSHWPMWMMWPSLSSMMLPLCLSLIC